MQFSLVFMFDTVGMQITEFFGVCTLNRTLQNDAPKSKGSLKYQLIIHVFLHIIVNVM
jgi:hypothetical protein